MSTLENEEPTKQRPPVVEEDGESTALLPRQVQPPAEKAVQDTFQQSPVSEKSEPVPAAAEDKDPCRHSPEAQDTDNLPLAPSLEMTQTTADEHVTNETSAQDQPQTRLPDTPTATIQMPSIHMQTAPTPQLATSLPVVPAMEIEDLLSLKIVSDPQISPDGTSIAYTIHECNAEEDTTQSAIWLVETSSTKAVVPRQLTAGLYHDTLPRWSPDGRTLAFVSDRSGLPQIYVLPLHGGEAQPVSALAQGVTEYSWHPNSQTLLAHSAWKPQDEQIKFKADRQATVYTHLDAQWDGVGHNYGRHQQLWLIPLAGKEMRLTSEPVDLVQSCWSPDGQEIVFCANRRSDPDLSMSMALWVLTLSTGQLRRLTPEEGLAQKPAWSPDGRTIAYLYTHDQTETGNIMPWIIDVQANAQPRPAVPEAKNVTCQAWIIDELRSEYLAKPEWYPNSQALLVPVQERGQLHLYRLDISQRKLERLTNGNGRYISPQLSHDGQTIAMVRADWFTPGDIWQMDGVGKQPRKLTRINDPILQSHRLTRPQRITWKSFDGQEIEGWLYMPQLPENSKAPLILAPHGGPSLAWGDSYVHEFQVLAGHGFAVLAPNPRGSAGYGEKFCQSILNDWGGADFKDLMAGMDHVIATAAIDGNRLAISGMSYGGYMTNFAITQTKRFRAAVSRNGISSLETAALLSAQTNWFTLSMSEREHQRTRSALTYVDAIQTPLLLLHAENDLSCPFSESQQLFVALRKQKKLVELIGYHNTSHLMDWPTVGTPQQRLNRLRRTIQWYERFV